MPAVEKAMTPLIAMLLMAPQHAVKLEPGSVFEGLFRVAVPKGVKVRRFYDDGPGMDPSFAWELAPLDRAFVDKVVKAAKLKRAPSAVESSSRWLKPWPYATVNRVPEVYVREFQDGGLRHLWVDPKGNRIFAEFLGT